MILLNTVHKNISGVPSSKKLKGSCTSKSNSQFLLKFFIKLNGKFFDNFIRAFNWLKAVNKLKFID